MVNCCAYALSVPAAYSKLQIWKNTPVASLQSGQTYTMPGETLGYEWDEPVDNGFQPPGEVDMSKTCEDVSQLLADIRSDVTSGQACNSLTLYRAPSGALVFDAGTVQWAWGLDSHHDGDAQNPADPAMQQATVNLFADMGVQPTTLMPGLVAGAAPSDTAPPASTITSPSAGTTINNGSTVTISGTATDSGGGVVAGVEVSTDGGSTWHPVTTMSAANTSVTWSYTWSAAGSGPVTIKSRATDDDGNMETPGAGVTVTVNCPCGLFGNNYTPSTTSSGDSGSYELGVKFQSSVAGWVAGVRFYKGSGNDGTHTGSLWSSSGQQLATGTFTNETASGWQTMTFANPIQISANTTYVVSYYDPDGHYAADGDLFDWALNTPPLTAVKSAYTGTGGGNGVYNAGGPGFPSSSYNGTSYGVDVIFDTTEPAGASPAVAGVTPYPGSSSNPVTTAPTATFSKSVVPSTVSFKVADSHGNAVAGSLSFNSDDTIATFTPGSSLAASTTYTVTISGAQDSFGQTITPYTYTFITSKAYTTGQCPCTIWPDIPPSSAVDADDNAPNNIGVQFQATTSGTITGIRFYKEAEDTGTHTGTLWTSNGTQLATGTFTNESTQGWEELDFSTPVTVTAGTTYVASYHTDTGHYADTPNGLSSAVTNGPLTALANGGVYAYGSSNTFPGSTYQDSNFWVDVVFSPAASTTTPAVTSTTPASGQTNVPTNTSLTATFNESVESSSIQFTLTGPGNVSVPGTVSYDSATDTASFVPSGAVNGSGALTAGATYTATVSGAQDASGNTMKSPYTWSFTTAQTPAQCPCSVWSNSAQPAVPAENDPNPNNIGVQFTSSENGWISGIRFYKGSTNTGTHTGYLWDSTGKQLGSVTFTNETASGWQEADFATPIPITSGTTYTASYSDPNGDYPYTTGGLSTAVSNGPLTALANGGVYAYGSSVTFPTNTYQDDNFWVDVVFTTTDTITPAVTSTTPASGQGSVAASAAPTATFNEPVQSGTINFTLTPSGGSAVAGSVTYDSSANTATFSPASALAPGTTYTASVSGAQDASGTTMKSAYTWTFTTAQTAAQCPCSIWPASSSPAVPAANDPNPNNIGVKFTVSQNGYITGIRFYKGTSNTGTHVGTLWNASGTSLGQVTFTNETASGWQQANFSTPIAVTTGTTYTASYSDPNGNYPYTTGGLSSAVTNGPVTAVANGGVYVYSSSIKFPTNTYQQDNFWVDVVYSTTP